MAFNLPNFLAGLTNPRWADVDHTAVAFDATLNGQSVAFVAHPNDVEAHGQKVLADALAGAYGTIGAYVAPSPPTQAQLAAQVVAAASAVCDAIVGAIEPDATHATAFANAASIVNGNGGAAPTAGPMAARFANLALAYGLRKSDGSGDVVALAAVVVALQGASLDLSNALLALQGAVAAATTAGDLAAALATFETAIAAVATEVNAVVPRQVAAPPAIVIAGVNA